MPPKGKGGKGKPAGPGGTGEEAKAGEKISEVEFNQTVVDKSFKKLKIFRDSFFGKLFELEHFSQGQGVV